MAVEKGQRVLLKVGDGGAVPITGVIYALADTAGVYTIHRSAGSFTGLGVGGLIHVTGFVQAASFHAIISALDTDDITFVNPVDDDGNPIVITDEAEGPSVSIVYETFNTIKGQDDSQMAIAASEIDASTKDTGFWGSSLSGTARMTVSANGKVNWPDTKGVKKIADKFNAGGDDITAWLKLVLNSAGDYWFGKFAITGANIGGAKDGPTTYQLSFANQTRPSLVYAA